MQDHKKLLDQTISAIEKQFGQGSILRLGGDSIAQAIPVINSGALSLDVALGVGGIPRGKIVEIYGPEASGKTTLTLQVLAEAQKTGGSVAFVDAEHSLDPAYARAIGVDIDTMLVSQPDNGEQALEIVSMLVASGAVSLVVVDSVAALTPRAEIEGAMGDSHVGLQARLMSQALRKLTGAIAKSQTTVIFINQLRMKIGVMFGNPETTTGGNALKFYSSVRLDVRRIGVIKQGEQAIGNRVKVKIVKNKVAAPFREAEFDIIFGKGVSKLGDVLDLATEKGVVEKSGSWFAFGDERLGQGRDNTVARLDKDPGLAQRIEAKVREAYGLPPAIEPTAAAKQGEADPGSDDRRSRKARA